jgi:hypothetical protein
LIFERRVMSKKDSRKVYSFETERKGIKGYGT